MLTAILMSSGIFLSLTIMLHLLQRVCEKMGWLQQQQPQEEQEITIMTEEEVLRREVERLKRTIIKQEETIKRYDAVIQERNDLLLKLRGLLY